MLKSLAMEKIHPDKKIERDSMSPNVLPPISIELFMARKEGNHNLPKEVVSNSKVIEQAEERRNLYNLCDRIFETSPDPELDIEEAMKRGLVTESDVAELWSGISDFLERDENNARILLYLPFEILPNIHKHESPSDHLSASGQRLADLYRKHWIELLFQHEPRANFVDGDILEPGLPEPERISKAGHLTPELIALGIITERDIYTLLESIKNKLFLKSVAEGAIVSIDRGLIDKNYLGKINAVIEKKFGKMTNTSTTREKYWDDPTSTKISTHRAAWLRSLAEESTNEKEAEVLSKKIVAGLDPHELANKGRPEVVVLGVIETGEFLAKTNPKKAKEFALDIKDMVQAIFALNDPKVKNCVIGGLNRWVRFGIVEKEFLQKLKINLTDLTSSDIFDNKYISEETEILSNAAKKIENHPLLSKILYPSFLLFGSRIKLYADSDADFDAAIFFRPEAKFEDRQKALEILGKDFPELAKIHKFLEFWVTQENEKFGFKVPKEITRTIVGDNQNHFLMGGIWIGHGLDFKKIRSDTLTKYLYLPYDEERKQEIRGQLLGQLELDVLQYRLMHKGYRKFYPRIVRLNTKNSDLIDWKSDYWDPGYRRVATKLFLSRVFLPDLS